MPCHYQTSYILYENIFGFDVPVVDCVGVQIPQPLNQLPDDVGGVFLGDAHFLLEEVPDLSVGAQLLQDVQVLLVREEAVELHHVGVFQAGVDFQLTDDLVGHSLVDDVLLRNHLQGAHKPSPFMLHYEDLPEMAFA